jgi:hypothetical protein
MTRLPASIALICLTLFLVTACSATPGTPAATTSSDPVPSIAADSSVPDEAAPAATTATTATDVDPCSHLTAADVAAAYGSAPVEIAERAGRGDCDYWLTEARDAKVNLAVASGPDADAYAASIVALGDPVPAGLGDESFSIYNEGFGTVLFVRVGSDLVAVQAFLPDAADQLPLARALVEVVLARR